MSRVLVLMLVCVDAYKILILYPAPAISHRVVLIPLVHELLSRQHEVTVITGAGEPTFQPTENLTEIVVDAQYEYAILLNRNERPSAVHDGVESNTNELFEKQPVVIGGDSKDFNRDTDTTVRAFAKIFEQAMRNPQIQELLKKEESYFDLVILEAWLRAALVMSHLFKAPAVQIKTTGSTILEDEAIGAPIHPTLYITTYQQRVYNLTLWEKLGKIYKYLRWQYEWAKLDAHFEGVIRRHLGADVPPLRQLACNVRLLLVNEHHIWAGNRPAPPSVVRVWGIHLQPAKPLPQKLESYLNASERGVVYMSLGTSHNSYFLPPHLIEVFVDALSQLPYDVLLKWDKDRLPGHPENVKTGKWFPQADLLRHPKVKLFITQGGMQSTDEAIEAGVPLLGIPMFADQAYQTEHYAHFGIGQQLHAPTLTAPQLVEAVHRVINDDSYRRNIIALRTLLHDEPPPRGAVRAAQHVEHVARHAHQTRAPTACLSWGQYLELELLALLVLAVVVVVMVVLVGACVCVRWRRRRKDKFW